MKSTTRVFLFLSVIALGALSVCTVDSQAGLVKFTNINQSTQTPGDPPNLYGPPDTSGPNMLLFGNPASFAANAIGAGGADVTDGFLTFQVMADPGTWATGIDWTESGFWSLLSPPGVATIATAVGNRLGGFITIDQSDVPPPALPIAISGPPLNYNAVANTPPDFQPWTNGFTFDLTPYGKVTKFSVAINNQLFAFSEASTIATIDKKRVKITVRTGMVPEPGTALIGVVGLLVGMAGQRFRRS